MKKYTNKTSILRCVVFEDGEAQFLSRGQSFMSDKSVKKVQDGIAVNDVTIVAKKTSKSNKK